MEGNMRTLVSLGAEWDGENAVFPLWAVSNHLKTAYQK